MRVKGICVVFLFISVLSVGNLINNPLFDSLGNFSNTAEVKVFYTTPPYYHDSIWTKDSRAMIFTQEVVDALVSDYADHAMLSEDERKAEQILTELYYLVRGWTFSIRLVSFEYPQRNFIKLDSSDCEVIRIILLNDSGERVEPIKIESTSAKRTSSGAYYVSNTVRFPKETPKREDIITEDTQWIEVWLFTATKKIGFRYTFY